MIVILLTFLIIRDEYNFVRTVLILVIDGYQFIPLGEYIEFPPVPTATN